MTVEAKKLPSHELMKGGLTLVLCAKLAVIVE